jgi:hypothetical protein
MADIKISDATPAGTLLETDLVPIARSGSNLPYNATMADLAAYVTVLASTHPPAMSSLPETPGVMQQYSRADHVHPTDQSRAPIDSPQFKGLPTGPTMLPTDNSDALATTKFVHDLGASGTLRTQTPGIDDNSELVATTEFVQNQGSTDPPLMDGIVTAGASRRFSRGDHTHPVDSSRYPASNPSGFQTAAQVAAVVPAASTIAPSMDGSAAVGTGTTWSRSDHVHPVDVSRYAASNPSNFQTAAQVTTIARTGTTTNDNAPAGQVGEYQGVQRLSTAGLTLTSGVDAALTSFVLTAGDWDVWGSVGFTLTNNNSTALGAWINPAGTGSPPLDQMGGNAYEPLGNNAGKSIVPLTPMRVSIAASATVTLGTNTTFSGGTHVAWGKLMARRVR